MGYIAFTKKRQAEDVAFGVREGSHDWSVKALCARRLRKIGESVFFLKRCFSLVLVLVVDDVGSTGRERGTRGSNPSG